MTFASNFDDIALLHPAAQVGVIVGTFIFLLGFLYFIYRIATDK